MSKIILHLWMSMTKKYFIMLSFLFLFFLPGYSEQGFVPDCSTDMGIPIPSGFPNENTTGPIGAGLSYDDLTPFTGKYSVSGKNNFIVENMDITGTIAIYNSSNVTIRRCRVTGAGEVCIVATQGTCSNIIIEDCEVISTTEGTSNVVGKQYGDLDGLIVRRCNLSGGADGLKIISNTTLEDCYIHHLMRWYTPSTDDWTHNDCIQSLGGHDITISGNTFLAPYKLSNAVFQCAAHNEDIDNLVFDGNYISGGGNAMNFRETNFSILGLEFKNNIYEDGSYQYGPLVAHGNISIQCNSFVSGGTCDAITGKCIDNTMHCEENEYTATIQNFSRDKTLFDSDMARGNNNAEVGLSGTSNAIDGYAIEARAVSTDDGGATSTDWRVIATIKDGKWSGVLNTPRSTSWYKAEVRVKGSTGDAVQTSNRFGVGLIIFHSGQSNYSRVADIDGDAPPITIGNNGDDFQMWHIVNRGTVNGSDENSSIEGPIFITDSKPKTVSLRAMAALYHKHAPGLKVMALFDVKPGTTQETTLKDSNNTRKWESIQKLFGIGPWEGTGPMADGQALGIFIQGHVNDINVDLFAEWHAATCLGKYIDGTDIPGISRYEGFEATDLFAKVGGWWQELWVNHVWPEAIPTIMTGRTQIQLKEPGAPYVTSEYPYAYDKRRQAREKLESLFPQHFYWANDYPLLKRYDDRGLNSSHFDVNSIYGSPLKGESLAVSVLRQIGELTFERPHFDIITKTSEYIELGSSVGPVTTMARAQGDNTNFTTELNPVGDVGKAEVLGFQYADFKQPTRVEIVDDNGNSASEGKIRVYLDPGYSELYYAMGGAGLPSGSWEFNQALFMRHMAIVDVGIRGGGVMDYGAWVEPYTDREFINQGIPDDAVSGVDLLSEATSIEVGETLTLTYALSPINASNHSASWTSSNTSVATVDANGVISALSEGQTTITVKTSDGGFTDQCNVTVIPSGSTPDNVALNKPLTVSNENLPEDPKEEFVDGDALSYWAASGFPQWAEIDLQGTFELSSIELITHQDRDYQYIVEAKTTDGTYTTIVDRSANADGKNLVDAVTVTATHVKITVSGAKTYTGTWCSLKELIVMGIPGSGTEPSSQQSAYASNALPGRIQVEDYDNGGEGIAFHDVDEKKLDLTLRPDDNVDIEATTDTDGEYNTGWMSDGEWLEYTLTDVAAGIYTISVRASSDKSNPGDVIIKLGDGPEGENFVTIATVPISGTGGWEKWQTFTVDDISIDAGTNKVLRFEFDEAGYDMNWVDFSAEIIPVDITLDKETAQIVVGESLQLTETVLPTGATDKSVTWSTSDASIATVDENGIVSALSTGQTTITATTNTGNLSATCIITVVTDIVAVDDISISDETLELNIGATSEISVTITPEDASDKSVTWSSSDENIATVDADGVVSALSAGQATVTVTSNDGDFTANCKVKVAPNIIAVESISISQTTAELTIDSTMQLEVTIAPENASNKTVSWSSSAPDVATVDENGLVTAIAEGTATISATTSSGDFTTECKVEVSLPNDDTGINNLAQNNGDLLSIYPNPNTGSTLYIDLPSGDETQNAIIKIYDLTGKAIFAQNCQGQHIEIELSCKKGIYIIEVSMPTTTSYKKLVVRH